MLKWSFSTLGCPELNLSQIAELAHRYGIKEVELRVVSDRLDLPVLFTEEYGEPAKLKQWLDEAGIGIVSIDSSAKLVGGSEETRGELVEMARWAHGIGCPYLRVFDGGQYASELSQKDLEGALEFMSWWRGLQKAKGLSPDVIIESHDCLTTTPAILALQEALGDQPAKILWDTHHTWKKGGEDPLETWKHIQQYVPHVHVKDSVSVPSANHPFSYRHLGQGEFPLREVLKQLEQDGFTGAVSLEWERKWHPYLDPLEVGLEAARKAGYL